MTSMKRAKAVLYLADGTLFEGLSIGKKGTSGVRFALIQG